MVAPLLIFVYARPDHTKKTIEAIAKNDLAAQTNVFIFSDAAKNAKTEEKVIEVRDYIDTLENRNLFKSVTIIKADKNKGLANSIISGVTQVIDKYEEVIVLEDDLVTSPDYLQYMNDALNYYRNNQNIWSISGYTFQLKIPENYNHDIFLSYRGCSWGWATWKDRWDQVDWEVTDYKEFTSNRVMRDKFNRGGRDMSPMLDMQMKGEVDSWAIRWCYSQSKLNLLTVYPVISRIQNIGLDGSGTHSGITNKYDSILYNSEKPCVFENIELNDEILKEFKDHYGTKMELFWSEFKTEIKKKLLLFK